MVSKFIIDEFVLFALLLAELLDYLETFMEVLIYYSFTLKLNKQIHRNTVGFFGIAMKYEGNTSVELKKVAFVELSGPKMILNLCMFIGVIKMYSP